MEVLRKGASEGGGCPQPASQALAGVEDALATSLELMQSVSRSVSGGLGVPVRQSHLDELIRYQLAGGGKRRRARLVLEVAREMAVPPEELVPFAACCELIHQASLTLDDVQDGDATRNSRPTLWSSYGRNQALNLAHGLVYYALSLLERLPRTRNQACRTAGDWLCPFVFQCLIDAVEGQQLEFVLKAKSLADFSEYCELAERKTGALLRLPLVGAARLCGATLEDCETLSVASNALGVSYQLADDLIDVYGEKGRDAIARDIVEGKRSALVVLALPVLAPAEQRALLEILDTPRQATSESQVQGAIALLDRAQARERVMKALQERRALLNEMTLPPALGRVVDDLARRLLDASRWPGTAV